MMPEGCLGISSPQAGGLHTTHLLGCPLDMSILKHAAGLSTILVADALCARQNIYGRSIQSSLHAACMHGEQTVSAL